MRAIASEKKNHYQIIVMVPVTNQKNQSNQGKGIRQKPSRFRPWIMTRADQRTTRLKITTQPLT
mgnify:CR=1 FL=1